MFNWVLCVLCVCVFVFIGLPQGGVSVCVCVLSPDDVCLVCVAACL